MKTEINIYILLSIIFIHWIGDFVLQTDKQAKEKSKSNYYLTMHVLSYSLVWFFACLVYIKVFGVYVSGEGVYYLMPNARNILWFPVITFVCHWITDFFTSRVNSRLLADGKTHNFFVSVGFDQILHYVQLILTFQLLS